MEVYFNFRQFLKENPKSNTQVAEILFHTIVELLKADMGTSHCEALDQILKCYKELTEYAQVISSMALRMA